MFLISVLLMQEQCRSQNASLDFHFSRTATLIGRAGRYKSQISENRVITVLMASCMLMDMPPAILLTKGARGLQEIVSLRLAS